MLPARYDDDMYTCICMYVCYNSVGCHYLTSWVLLTVFFDFFSISSLSFFLCLMIVVIRRYETCGRRQASMLSNIYKN